MLSQLLLDVIAMLVAFVIVNATKLNGFKINSKYYWEKNQGYDRKLNDSPYLPPDYCKSFIYKGVLNSI